MMSLKVDEPLGAHTVVIVRERTVKVDDEERLELSADDMDGCRIGITYGRNDEVPDSGDVLELWATHYARKHATDYSTTTVQKLPCLGDDELWAVRFGEWTP